MSAIVTRPPGFTAIPTGTVGATVDVRTVQLYDNWLGTLGPACCVLWQHLARELAAGRNEFTIDALARYSGLMHGKVWGALDRLVLFGRGTWLTDAQLQIDVVTGIHVPRPKAPAA